MKIRDKDGNVFEDIANVLNIFCGQQNGERPCKNCILFPMQVEEKSCRKWGKDHPAEAARLMGYEVVEDESLEADMDKQKPLKDWALEEIRVECGKHPVKCTGCVAYASGECFFTKFASIYPEAWYFYEPPRFTEEEVAIMRYLQHFGINHICRNTNGTISGREHQPVLNDSGLWKTNGGKIHWLLREMFPSILPGQSVSISEIVGGATE